LRVGAIIHSVASSGAVSLAVALATAVLVIFAVCLVSIWWLLSRGIRSISGTTSSLYDSIGALPDYSSEMNIPAFKAVLAWPGLRFRPCIVEPGIPESRILLGPDEVLTVPGLNDETWGAAATTFGGYFYVGVARGHTGSGRRGRVLLFVLTEDRARIPDHWVRVL
jgi:HAMP domain-containing protein